MPAAKLDLTVEQGATFRHVLTLRAGAVPYDLTGHVARMQLRADVRSPTTLLELTSENGRLVIDALAGKITLVLDATTTAGMTSGTAIYDLEIEAADGTVTRLVQGKVKVLPEVTR